MTLFTSRNVAVFYDKLFSALDFKLPHASRVLSLQECSFLADKGYDARSIYNAVRDVYDGEAVIPLKRRGTRGGKDLTAGNPVCEAGLAMHKDGKRNRGCTKYKTVPTDYRFSIDRSCLRFRRLYALRTECERYNSRFKAAGQERLWVRNGKSVADLNTLPTFRRWQWPAPRY